MSGDDGFGMNDAPETVQMTGETQPVANAQPQTEPVQGQAAVNPSSHRMIEGRDQTFVIPRDQQGQPFKEYFQNARMPADLENALVFRTEKGPVLASPDPVAWGQAHDQKAQYFADQVKTQIDEHGYYSKRLNSFAKSLSDETGHKAEETRAMIVKQFELKHGVDPYRYLANVREHQGLPVRDQQRPAQRQKQGQ